MKYRYRTIDFLESAITSEADQVNATVHFAVRYVFNVKFVLGFSKL